MSLRTKGLTLISFLSTILMGMGGGGFASAASTPVALSGNPDSPQSVTFSHVIHNAYPQSNAKLYYQIDWCEERPAMSVNTSFRPIVGNFEFKNQGRNDDGDSIISDTVSFSDFTFNVAGTYEFCAFESMPDADGGIPVVDSTRYKITVDVVNEYDGSGNATGNLIPTLSAQGLNLTTGEKGEIVFQTTAEKTSMQFTHNVSGAKADREHYFPYDVQLPMSRFIAQGTRYTLEGLDAEFNDQYAGKTKSNPTEIVAGYNKYRVYLKEGQTLRIGKRGGVDDLPVGTAVEIEAVTENSIEESYAVTINGQAQNSFEALLSAQLGDNPSEAELASFQANNDIKILRASQQNAVSTGVVARVMPFVALVFIAGVVGFVAYKSDKKKARSL